MKKIGIIVLLCFLAIQIKAQATKKISLQDAFSMAIQNSKQLQIDSLKKQAIDIKKKQTQNAMIPSIGINASYTRLSDNIDPFVVTLPAPINTSFTINPIVLNQFNNRVSLQQPIFQGLKNWNTIKALEQQKLAMDFDIQKDKEDLKLTVLQNYFNLYKFQQSNNLYDSNIVQTQVRVDDLVKFKNAGLALNNDVMRAELQKTNLLVSKADIESAIGIYNFNLCLLLGLDYTTKIEVENPEVVKEADNTIQYLLTTSHNDRAELKAQYYKTKASNYQIKASKSAYMPTVNAIGNGYYSNPNPRVFPSEAKFKATWDVGVGLSWNIMQLYTARAIVNDAKNQKEQLLQFTEQIKEGISMEVNAAYETLKVSLLKIDLAKRAIEQATENKRILDNRFGAQVALITDVLDADVFLLQAQTNLLNAQADAAIANYKLQRSLGVIK